MVSGTNAKASDSSDDCAGYSGDAAVLLQRRYRDYHDGAILSAGKQQNHHVFVPSFLIL